MKKIMIYLIAIFVLCFSVYAVNTVFPMDSDSGWVLESLYYSGHTADPLFSSGIQYLTTGAGGAYKAINYFNNTNFTVIVNMNPAGIESDIGVVLAVNNNYGAGGYGYGYKLNYYNEQLHIYRLYGTDRTEVATGTFTEYGQYSNVTFKRTSEGKWEMYNDGLNVSLVLNNADVVYKGFTYGGSIFSGAGGYIDIININPTGTVVPFVNITSPSNNTNINSNTLVIYDVNDGGESSSCKFLINDSLKVTESKTTGSYNFSFNDSVWNNGYNLINVSCNNSIGSSSDIIYLFVDSLNPVINYAKVCQGSDGLCFDINNSVIDENLIHNISVSDSNLYSINVTWYWRTTPTDIEYSDKVTGINGSTYRYSKTVDLALFDESDGNFSCYVEVCDAHTDLTLRDLPVIEADGEKIIDDITIKEVTAGVIDTTTTKLSDRYIFDYTLDKEISDFRVDIESPEYIDIIKNSPYKGHMVTGKKWIDFENDIGASVELVRVNDYKVTAIIRTKSPVSYLKFSSVGEINCINETFDARVEIEGDTVNATAPPDSSLFVVNDTNKLINFSYIPYYTTAPDNCSLWLNSVRNNTDYTISKNVNNSFLNVKFGYPLAQQYANYSFYFTCTDLHLHPPLYSELHTTTSLTRTFQIFNNATSTTTTTTTIATTTTEDNTDLNVSEFSSVEQGIYYFFLMAMWVAFLVMTLTMKGKHGKTIQLLNMAQGFMGFVAGANLFKLSIPLGLVVTFTAIGILVGKWMYDS